MRYIVLATAAATLLSSACQANVTAQSASGFAIAQEADLKVSPQKAFDAFVAIGKWWDMDHSYTHDGANMHMDLKPGGAWYETLPGGGYVTHLTITQSAPGERLVLTGGLGPLAYMGVNGALTISFAKTAQGTHVKLSYAVGGFDPGEFKVMSKAVDGVWTAQLARYQRFANSGQP
jgi:uncharacterized protein YndB with AHSA1/START domain